MNPKTYKVDFELDRRSRKFLPDRNNLQVFRSVCNQELACPFVFGEGYFLKLWKQIDDVLMKCSYYEDPLHFLEATAKYKPTFLTIQEF